MHSPRTNSLDRSTVVVLLVTASIATGCASDTTEPEVDRNAPAQLLAITPRNVFAQVASSVIVSVRAVDSLDAPVGGVPVTFEVTLGDGSIISATTDTTGPGGAAAATWLLGTGTGTHMLRASIAGVSAVQFIARAHAGPAAAMEMLGGDLQTGTVGEALAEPLRVRLTDIYGNAVPSRQVSFNVTAGGGSIAAAFALTDHAGIAVAGPWTLGSAGGQRVSATSGSLTSTFTATATICPSNPIGLGVSANGVLATGDCRMGGVLADQYEYTSATTSAVAISLSSPDFLPRATVSSTTGVPVADEAIVTAGSPFILLSSAGSRFVTARSVTPAGSGGYTLSIAAAPTSISGCVTVFVERPLTTTQQLQATDCQNTDYYYYDSRSQDRMLVYLSAGAAIRVVMSATAFTPWAEIRDSNGLLVTSCLAGTTATCHYTAQNTGYYQVRASSWQDSASGAYTLTID